MSATKTEDPATDPTEAVRYKVNALRFVLAEREAELLAIKGHCSNADCRLHYAHRGPCDITRSSPVSAKQAAAYHGADIATRLRAYGPESDYDGVMQEAASEIDRLRKAEARAWDEGHHAGVLNATGEYNEPLHDNPYGRSSDV